MNQNFEIYSEEDSLTLSEIERMSDKELEELHLLSINSIGLQSVNTYYYVSSFNVRQSNSFYCGPLSTLQMIRSAGKASSVSVSNNTAKQKTLANNSNLGTDRDGATWINNVSKTLNTFIPRTRN